MNARDRFEQQRANDAREWCRRPEREAERLADIAAQRAADIAAGHLPQCSLTRCAAACAKS
jgi:hypothetical protein